MKQGYKHTPMSIKTFQEVYKISQEDLIYEYKKYLEVNKNIHYYAGFKNITVWYLNQITRGM